MSVTTAATLTSKTVVTSDETAASRDSPGGKSLVGVELVRCRGSGFMVLMLTMYHLLYCLSIIFREVDDTRLSLKERVAACSFEKR
jgi:hypothetical protein